MKVLSLTCNHCGAPLEVPESTRFLTCRFCNSRLEIHQDGAAAYTEVLEALDQRTARMEDQLNVLQIQNEVERLDREWESERESYLVSGRNGTRRLPTKTGSLVGTLIVGGVGAFWMAIASQVNGFFALIGVFVIAIAIIGGVHGFMKATQYDARLAAHQERRSAILGRLAAETDRHDSSDS
jgi:hypothetical protein